MLAEISDFTAPALAEAGLTRNGTADPHTGKARVYGGDKNLVHIKDGTRKSVGEAVADFLDDEMRFRAAMDGKEAEGLICPGCAMIALFNAAIHTAERNGQSRTELANTMSAAFAKLAADPQSGLTEEIEVILDPDCEVQ
jgi:hypothetical protein